MEIFLIRHTSVDVPPGVCYGQTDVPLKPTFEQEAAITKKICKPVCLSIMFTAALSPAAYALPPIAAIRTLKKTRESWKSTSAVGK